MAELELEPGVLTSMSVHLLLLRAATIYLFSAEQQEAAQPWGREKVGDPDKVGRRLFLEDTGFPLRLGGTQGP